MNSAQPTLKPMHGSSTLDPDFPLQLEFSPSKEFSSMSPPKSPVLGFGFEFILDRPMEDLKEAIPHLRLSSSSSFHSLAQNDAQKSGEDPRK